MAQHGDRPEKIHALTSLRFFAAIYVVCFHVLHIASFLPWIGHDSILGKLVGLGYVSVSFFFLLSGYILAIVYLRRGGPIARGKFFLARFARVYPLLFLTLLADIPYFMAAEIPSHGFGAAVRETATALLGNAALLQAWTLRWRFLNEPSWSLSTEAVFYLSFPFLGAALWKLRGVSLWTVAAVLYIGGQALIVAASHHTQGEMLKRLPLLHMTTFALGILLARWQTLHQAARHSDDTSDGTLRWLVLVPVLASLVAVVFYSARIPVASLHDGLLAPVFLLVIWAFSQSRWWPARLLGAAWLVVLGEASYGLYLIHLPVFHVFQWLGWDRIPWLFPVYIAVSVGLSVVSFYCFETPVRKWILKRARSPVKETMEMASDAQ